MTSSPIDLLNAAEAIANECHSVNDALTRAVISRAYYACYHHALAQAKTHGFNAANARNGPAGDPKMGTHELLIDEMTKSKNQELRQCAARLRKMRTHRVNADYYLHSPLVIDCRQILSSAKNLMAK